VGNIVPGIDFSNDPLLQGRLFSYTDTQLIRLGGPNFHEIPINRPVAPLHNNQRDGFMRQMINSGRVSYSPNSLAGNFPAQVPQAGGGFVSYAERIDSQKVRARSESFFDHYTQAAMFFHSQSEPEQNHIVRALQFELGKVETPHIRIRVLYHLSQIDKGLAKRVAEGLGLSVPTKIDGPPNMSIPADGDPKDFQSKRAKEMKPSPALSMANTPKGDITTRKVAVLMSDGFDDAAFAAIKKVLTGAGAVLKVVGPRGGSITGKNGDQVSVDFSLLTCASVLFDAVCVIGGAKSVIALQTEPAAIHFVEEAYKHCKAIAALAEGIDLLAASQLGRAGIVDTNLDPKKLADKQGVVVGRSVAPGKLAAAFVQAIGEHRHWTREDKDAISA
jgi:catalase